MVPSMSDTTHLSSEFHKNKLHSNVCVPNTLDVYEYDTVFNPGFKSNVFNSSDVKRVFLRFLGGFRTRVVDSFFFVLFLFLLSLALPLLLLLELPKLLPKKS